MALQGKYTYKGVNIDEAYIVIKDVNASSGYQTISELKTEAEYNDDGSLKTEAVYETSINKVLSGSYTVNVYKDKSSKDADPNGNVIVSTYGTYTPKHTASAKNDFAQAYIALKAIDAFKDLADA